MLHSTLVVTLWTHFGPLLIAVLFLGLLLLLLLLPLLNGHRSDLT